MEETLWKNGAFLNLRTLEALISPADRGFTLADGVFDTMLAVEGAPVYPKAHFERLRGHANVLGIDCPETPDHLESVARELLQKNACLTGRVAIRTTLTRGAGGRGIAPPDPAEPTLLMRCMRLPETTVPAPLSCIFSSVRRNEFSPLSRIKSLNYGDMILALREAHAAGADNAILLNTSGRVACATNGNLFIRKQGRLLTPPLDDGAMDGITRAVLIEREGGCEESLSPEDLMNADCIFLTNSISGVVQITQIDGQKVRTEGPLPSL